MKSTHRVAFYPLEASKEAGTDVQAKEFASSPVAEDVRANLQLETGTNTVGVQVTGGPAGRQVDRDAKSLLEPGDLGSYVPSEGDGMTVQSGPWTDPKRFEVVGVGRRREGWKLRVDLEQSDEDFG